MREWLQLQAAGMYNRSHERTGIMGDSGEGLIDAESKIQERMEEMRESRERERGRDVRNPEKMRQLGSLGLARTQLTRQLESATHDDRRRQITHAISDIDLRIAGLQ
jgi:hypothetical protein